MLNLWKELDISSDEDWECAGDITQYKNKGEKEKMFEFLDSLDRDLNDLRERILIQKPLSNIREALIDSRREENC